LCVLERNKVLMVCFFFFFFLSRGRGGCPSLADRTPPFTLPGVDQIEAIVISPVFGENRQDRRIVDREKLDGFVRFVHRKDTAWKPLWDTPPSLRYVVRVEGKGEDLVRFRISPGLMTCGRQDKCPITATEWGELKDILGITVD